MAAQGEADKAPYAGPELISDSLSLQQQHGYLEMEESFRPSNPWLCLPLTLKHWLVNGLNEVRSLFKKNLDLTNPVALPNWKRWRRCSSTEYSRKSSTAFLASKTEKTWAASSQLWSTSALMRITSGTVWTCLHNTSLSSEYMCILHVKCTQEAAG